MFVENYYLQAVRVDQCFEPTRTFKFLDMRYILDEHSPPSLSAASVRGYLYCLVAIYLLGASPPWAYFSLSSATLFFYHFPLILTLGILTPAGVPDNGAMLNIS
jgi:hypothetical protein